MLFLLRLEDTEPVQLACLPYKASQLASSRDLKQFTLLYCFDFSVRKLLLFSQDASRRMRLRFVVRCFFFVVPDLPDRIFDDNKRLRDFNFYCLS